MEHVLTYTEACSMSNEQLNEINAALDYYFELVDKQNKKKR
jgi:uncharacterized protein YdaU (DUF1376 family)